MQRGGGVKSPGLKQIIWVFTSQVADGSGSGTFLKSGGDPVLVFTDTLLLTYLNTLLVATMTTFINFMVSSIDIKELSYI